MKVIFDNFQQFAIPKENSCSVVEAVELIESIPGNEPLRMYWHGNWQDLCRGPHLQHTGQVPADAFKLMSIAGAYWR